MVAKGKKDDVDELDLMVDAILKDEKPRLSVNRLWITKNS
jgi:hypothetical protein